MKKNLPKMKELFKSVHEAQQKLNLLTPQQRSHLEKSWDVEHAYYSSALEGSKLDKKEFEKLGEKVQ